MYNFVDGFYKIFMMCLVAALVWMGWTFGTGLTSAYTSLAGNIEGLTAPAMERAQAAVENATEIQKGALEKVKSANESFREMLESAKEIPNQEEVTQ